jgi:hypothetical protein
MSEAAVNEAQRVAFLPLGLLRRRISDGPFDAIFIHIRFGANDSFLLL